MAIPSYTEHLISLFEAYPLLYDIKQRFISQNLWNAHVSFMCSSHNSYCYALCADWLEIQGLHTQFVISFNFVPLFHQSSYSQGSNNSSPGSHFLLQAISPLMLPSNVTKCMLNVASTMLPAAFGQQHVAVECCLNVA